MPGQAAHAARPGLTRTGEDYSPTAVTNLSPPATVFPAGRRLGQAGALTCGLAPDVAATGDKHRQSSRTALEAHVKFLVTIGSFP